MKEDKRKSHLIESIFGSEANLIRMRIYEILLRNGATTKDIDTELLQLCREDGMSREDVAAAIYGRVVCNLREAHLFVNDLGELCDGDQELSNSFKAGSLLGLFQAINWAIEDGFVSQFRMDFPKIIPKILSRCDNRTISETLGSPYKRIYEQQLLPLVKDYPRKNTFGSEVKKAVLLMKNLSEVFRVNNWTTDEKVPEIVKQVTNELFYGIAGVVTTSERVTCMTKFASSFGL